MNTPDVILYDLYRERERLVRELYLMDEKINNHLFTHYSLKRAHQALADRMEAHHEKQKGQ